MTGPQRVMASVAAASATKQISLLVLHIFIAFIVSVLLSGPQRSLLPVLACYSLPVIARLADFPSESLQVGTSTTCTSFRDTIACSVDLRCCTTSVARW